MTERDDAIVAIYATHEAAEAAIRKVAEAGLDMKRFSIIGKGYHTEEKVIGFYSSGDRVRFWGSRGAFWGGLWGLMFGGLLVTIPVIGPVVVLGHLATAAYLAITGVAEGAVVAGGLGALGAALFSVGIPHHGVLQYEEALKADQFLVVGHGPAADLSRAKTLLDSSGPTQIDIHLDVTPTVQAAA